MLQLTVDKKSVFDLISKQKSSIISIVPTGGPAAKVSGGAGWLCRCAGLGHR